jgi:hypothetical protein
MSPADRRRVAERIAAHVRAIHLVGGAALLLVLAVHVDALTRWMSR